MKKVLFFITLFSVLTSYAQVGIGTSSPDASAQLDVVSTNKGILIPRVKLTGSLDVVSVSNPKESLLVYNTSTTNDVTPGFYYWNSLKWVSLSSGTFSGNVSIANGGTGATTASGALSNLGAQKISNMTDVLGSTSTHYPSESAVKLYVDNESVRAISSEGLLRADIDLKATKSDLGSEVLRSITAENLLQTGINLRAETATLNNEIIRATNSEAALQSNIDLKASKADLIGESARATTAENLLQTGINSRAAITTLNNEIVRATNSETALQSNIDLKASQADLIAENSRATTAENLLQTGINSRADIATLNNEIVRATNSEAVLQSNIGLKASQADLITESSRATAAEAVLQSNIDLKASQADLIAENSRATTAENLLQTGINSRADIVTLNNEITRATNSEAILQSNISLKASQADLNIENVRAVTAEGVLQADINTREKVSNKSTVIDVQTDDVLYPSVKAVKTYVDSKSDFYTADGSLSNVRTVNQNGNDLTFSTGAGKLVVDGAFKHKGIVLYDFIRVPSTSYTVPSNINTIVYEGGNNAIFTMPAASSSAGMEIKIYNVTGYDVYFSPGTLSLATGTASIVAGTAGIMFCDGTIWYLLRGGL
ncbi:hypothetical protein ACHRVZ_15560 [Flavobacterium sp. FlaQc-57]|uniref:hypothetical protein n=1 Tax=Flavobacterium sp. FlaQc-57 TaxID=3374186 RepID=UPI003757BDA3